MPQQIDTLPKLVVFSFDNLITVCLHIHTLLAGIHVHKAIGIMATMLSLHLNSFTYNTIDNCKYIFVDTSNAVFSLPSGM